MKKVKSILIVLLILAIVLIVVLNIFKKEENENIEKQVKQDSVTVNYKKVKNPHMYFTVKSCIEKYLYYIQQEDSDSLYKILDYEFIEQFDISQDNIYEHLDNITGIVRLNIDEMLVLEKSEHEHEYYILGFLQEETIDGISEEKIDFIVTVNIDLENMIYSIIPNGYGGPYEEK